MKLMTIACGLVLTSQAAFAGIFPKVVPDLDLPQFLGKWYQIASTDPFFQRDCVCVTAEYEINDNGNVDVINSCRKGAVDGELDVAIGEAKTTRNPAKLNVSFGGFGLPFSNYWVVDLAEDYSYAVISTPFRTPIWILSRTPDMEDELYSDILQNLDERGFRINSINPTLQAGCDN
ncbi:lipocalin family protein [Pseudobacteriovorax antillogorgiicola]|uniref:Apolipoprotein D and lipocalin family protein n=1 Tax=Pseudobacteriovorax antillogorgiicola TaxID=1513793 RepID=A0A1Y6CA33_9BACT|nr:lipocalin family protein [Pseudobacteriovorax antillogorgiicola]TCS49045.1 apolipoprotein D and lipocalin family protein [Pseudobacteriovorax antillogorgiicola]SMF52606.1 apolipoprotein D and lipocalin family protein [Pseudobacteriovorax antillogorgiicola]